MRANITSLLLCGALLVAPPSWADDEEELTDREFIEEAMGRINVVQDRADHLDSYARQRMGNTNTGQDRFGVDTGTFGTSRTRQRTSGLGIDDNLDKLRRDIRTLKRNADRAYKDIGQMRRTANGAEQLDRDAIDGRVRRLEREADDIERDMRRL